MKRLWCVLLLAGCSGGINPNYPSGENGPMDRLTERSAEELERAGNFAAAAELYTRMGEILLGADGFIYAHVMFEKALRLDPSNLRAGFYSAFTTTGMAMEGYVPRLMPLTENQDRRDLLRHQKEIENSNLEEFKKFALEIPKGKSKLDGFNMLQDYLRNEMLPALQISLTRLEKVVNAGEVGLNINLKRLGFPNSEVAPGEPPHCYRDKDGSWTCDDPKPGSGSFPNDSFLRATVFNVDRHDLMIVQGYFQAAADWIRVVTAYSANDWETVVERFREKERKKCGDGEGKLSVQDVVEILHSLPTFGALSSQNELAAFTKTAPETLSNWLQLTTLSNQLCKNKLERMQGQRLIVMFCIAKAVVERIQIGARLIKGRDVLDLVSEDGRRTLQLLVDVSAFIYHPIKDLKSLLPNRFDKDGYPIGAPDPTLGGVFPNGDFVQKLEELNGDFHWGVDRFLYPCKKAKQ